MRSTRSAHLSRHVCARSAAALLATSALLTAPAVHAEGTALRPDLVEAKTIRLDGVPKEWPSGPVPLTHDVRGHAAKPDLAASAFLAYDDKTIFVGAEVTDDVLRAGADHVSLVVGFPGGATHEIELYPGDPGKSPGRAQRAGGGAIAGAKVVEAPREGGWSLEASIPWSALPESRLLRVGLRGALFVHDADASRAIESVVGSAPSTAYARLPALSMEAEQALSDGLLREKGLREAPRCNLLADVVGDAMKERVLVFDRYLVVLGPTYRAGKEYYYADLGVSGPMVAACEARDVTGDGQSEIVLRKRVGSASKWRELMQVLSFGSGDVPNPVFQHEVAIRSGNSSIVNDVAFVPDGGKTAIRVEPGKASGWDAGSYREPTETSYAPVLLPWGTIRSQRYELSGAKFEKASEEAQTGAPAPAARTVAEKPLPPRPPPPSASALQKEVLALYQREHHATGRPRFDFAVDVVADPQPERVLVFGRDLVVMGKGYRNGTAYSMLTLSQLASPADVLEVTSQDVTGDGKAEILVRGVVHAPAPAEAGGGTVDREVLLVYQVGLDLKRIFAAELARAIGHDRVAADVELGSSFISLAPGRATGWTEKTYPFNQDSGPVGGFEPLLLPWGGAKAVRYRWTGGGFAR
jgi:hypothetical protein